jgi:outer membrane receptor protein involved in Fe transport
MLRYDGFKGNDISTGIDYNYAVFERTAVAWHDQHRGGFYIQDNARLGGKFWLTGAARLDMVRNTADSVENPAPVVSPSLAALYRPLDLLGLRLSVGRGFRAPSLQELYQSRLGHEDAVINGNPGLKPEHSTTVNGSVEWSPCAPLSITLGGAVTWLQDMILYVKLDSTHDTAVFDPVVGDTPTVPVFNRENVARAFVGEADITVRWKMRPVELQAGYSYTYNQDRTNKRILNYYPGSGITARVSGEWGTRWSLQPFIALKAGIGRKIWSMGMEAGETNGEEKLGDYEDVSAGASLSFMKKYTFFVKAGNLLGQEIENYEDVLMKTNGDRILEAGLKLSAF